MNDVLQRLDGVLEQRRRADPRDSYVAGLHRAGLNRILEKIGEESAEVILAAKDARDEESRRALIAETADLWFHCMVMLSHLGANSAGVLAELERRCGVSGLEEKASRAAHSK